MNTRTLYTRIPSFPDLFAFLPSNNPHRQWSHYCGIEFRLTHEDDTRLIRSIEYSIRTHTQPISFIVHFRRIARHSWLIHCPMTQSRCDTDTWSNRDNHSQIFDRRSSAYTALGIVGLSLFSLLYCHLLRGALVCLVFWRVDTSEGF